MLPWFGPKSRYDFGVANWQGWLAIVIFMTASWALRTFFKPEAFGLPHWAKPAATLGLIACILAVVWATYDREA